MRLLLRAAALLAAASALSPPTAPVAVQLTPLSGSATRTAWEPPLSDGGQAVSSYRVEWDTDPGTQEVQLISTAAYVTASLLLCCYFYYYQAPVRLLLPLLRATTTTAMPAPPLSTTTTTTTTTNPTN